MILRPLQLRFRAFIDRIWLALWERVPDRSKRMCVLASLYARIMGITEDDTEQLANLGRGLELSRDPKALRLPALMAPYLWRGVRRGQPVETERQDVVVSRLLRKTPCWLRYADDTTMRDDLHTLFNFCQQVERRQPVR